MFAVYTAANVSIYNQFGPPVYPTAHEVRVELIDELDAESIRCLHCHLNGGNAPSLNVDTIEELLLGCVYGNHLVGIDYNAASLTGIF